VQTPALETRTVDVPAAAATVTEVLEISKLHSNAACDTVKVFPAIVMVPVRAAPVLAETE